MSVAIKIESVSKLYRLGTVGTGTMAHDLNRWWHTIRGKEDPYAKVGQINDRTQSSTKNQEPGTKNRESSPDYVWALRDINLEVQQGEILGIIGRNGAGKSTLLKLLSRVTAPTTGSIKTKGRIASLLEVGTGFHPELTGRENIYMNGAILGMRRHEIARKLEEIVEFSGCEKYIDTPVKRYSSGMTVRLGFAVAAYLECEILIVDEVLAVGDMEFQKKCLDKLSDVSTGGRTVFFVSHNMSAIARLCPRVVLIANGQLSADGPAAEITSEYLSLGRKSTAEISWEDSSTPPQSDVASLISVRICNENLETTETASVSERVGIQLTFDVHRDGNVLVPNFPVHNDEGVCVFHLSDTSPEWFRKPRPRGRYSITGWIPAHFMAEGAFTVGAALTTISPLQVHFFVPEVLRFYVVDTGDGITARGDYLGAFPGVVRPKINWDCTFLG
jgi:lipopolysaccharide transport system ATP-binding protein